jgi:hypothetical protein
MGQFDLFAAFAVGAKIETFGTRENDLKIEVSERSSASPESN